MILNRGPNGFGNSMIASGNFTNIATNNAADGAYTLNGVPCAITDIIDMGSEDTNLDLIADLDADGIFCPDGVLSTRSIAIKSPLLDTLLADGFSMIIEYQATASAAVQTVVHDPDFNLYTSMRALSDDEFTQLTDKTNNHIQTFPQAPLIGQINKTAFTCIDNSMSASTNGATAVTLSGDGALDILMSAVFLAFEADVDSRLRSFAFYEVVDDADLPTLSTP
jgi:hypothetical protein